MGDVLVEVRTARDFTLLLTLPYWRRYNDCIIATGSVDKSIKLWDVRSPQRELAVMHGHKWVPAAPAWFACVCEWRVVLMRAGGVLLSHGMLATGQPHICAGRSWRACTTLIAWRFPPYQNLDLDLSHRRSYAVRRLTFSPHAEHLLASCSYDMTVKLWDTSAPQVRAWAARMHAWWCMRAYLGECAGLLRACLGSQQVGYGTGSTCGMYLGAAEVRVRSRHLRGMHVCVHSNQGRHEWRGQEFGRVPISITPSHGPPTRFVGPRAAGSTTPSCFHPLL